MTLPLETIISMWKDHDADIEYQLPDGSWEYVEYPDFNSTKVFRIYKIGRASCRERVCMLV